MRAFNPIFASILVGFYVITPSKAEETKNPDGTYTSVTTESDVEAAKQPKYDPLGTGIDRSLQRPSLTRAQAAKLFPEETAREAKRAEDRANMTQAQRDYEKRMLDRTPPSAGIKVIHPNITETNAYPKRS